MANGEQGFHTVHSSLRRTPPGAAATVGSAVPAGASRGRRPLRPACAGIYTDCMSQTRTHLSAGVAVLRDTPAGRRFLLLRAWRYWDFPKGAVEPGETPLQAAVREVREETGLDDLEFLHGEVYAETAPYNRGKVARYYLALTRTDAVTLSANPVTGIREHMEYRWLGYPQAAQLVTPRVKLILDWAESLASGTAPVAANSDSAQSEQPHRE